MRLCVLVLFRQLKLTMPHCDMVQVIDAHGEDFDEMNVATCFHELAKIAKGKSQEELEEMHVHETFQTLVGVSCRFTISLV